jgi:hypothetical protein
LEDLKVAGYSTDFFFLIFGLLNVYFKQHRPYIAEHNDEWRKGNGDWRAGTALIKHPRRLVCLSCKLCRFVLRGACIEIQTGDN